MSTVVKARPEKPLPRSRAAAKEASRAALIAAAMELFALKGLDVSLDEVCARAGYTRGAFYVHFKDRDELIAAVMERVGRGSLAAMLGAGEEEDLGTIIRRFAEGLESGDHPISRKGGVRPYQLLDACARSPAIRERYVALVAESTSRLAEVLRSHQRGGAIRADVDPRAVATLFEALVIGLEIMHDVEAPVDLEASAAALLKLLADAPR
jgi:TetR/AcrR family transcriptional repressor of nem operon